MAGVPGGEEDVPELPVTARDCGELAALSVMVRVVLRRPEARGVKTTDTEQDEPGATGEAQVLALIAKSAALEPARETLEICNAALRVWERERDGGRREKLMATVRGKASDVPGFRVTTGAGGGAARAVPSRAICCGLPGALSVITSDAWLEP